MKSLAAMFSNDARPRIALISGEASGDALGAGLIRELRARYPDARFAGIGGDAMRIAGMETWYDSKALSVMGLVEIVSHLPRLLSLRGAIRRKLLAWKPDVFIGVDAPDFNLGVERWLKRRGVRTVHYVSPSVWAWRSKRARTIGECADIVLCLFPMEPPIYAQYGIDARFVGHPFADEMPLDPDRPAAREQLRLSQQGCVLAVLPGSRIAEIERLGEIFIAAANQVAAIHPTLQIVVPAANVACHEALSKLLSKLKAGISRVRLVDGNARTAMIAADVVLLASGTATLEAMLAKRPMVVGYRVANSTYAIVKRLGLLKIQRYALPNVLSGSDMVPEYMQEDCTANNLANAVLGLLRNPDEVAALQPRFHALHLQLQQNASFNAAEAVSELLQSSDAPGK